MIASSADPLLRTAAQVYAVHEAGGLMLVEDPASARAGAMPAAAIALGGIARVLPLVRIGAAVVLLVGPPPSSN